MKITMLGTGTGIIHKLSRSPAMLIESQGESVLVDCGWGVPDALNAIDFPLHTLTHLCITHSHADHMAALPAVMQSLTITNIHHLPGEERDKPLLLYGYPGIEDDVRMLARMMVPEFNFERDLRIYEPTAPTHFGAFTIQATEVKHVPTLRCVAYRISDGTHTVVVSGDLVWDEAFASVIQDADLAILDASMPIREFKEHSREYGSHLSAEQCGMWAQRGRVKHLVLNSLYGLDTPQQLAVEVQKHYQGILTVPHDLQVIELV